MEQKKEQPLTQTEEAVSEQTEKQTAEAESIETEKKETTEATSKKETTAEIKKKQTKETQDLKEEKTWKQLALHKGWDYGLAFVLLALSCFLLNRLYTLSLLSFDWMWKIALLLGVINLLLFLLLFVRKMPQWGIWVRRCGIVLLCGVLTYGSIVSNTLQASLEAITQPETATTVNVSLITKRDGGAKHLEDLSNRKIGIQTANDAANSTYVKEQLNKESELHNVTYVEGIDYDSLYQKLMNEEIDALIITDYYFKTLLKDSYPTIEDDIFILKSYQKEKETQLSSTNKDIRYEPFTVYIAGVDEGEDPSIDARSDVNIILIVNPLANHIEMVSIPRDSFVPNPALGYANDKLTHLGLNGVENSMKGIEQILGFEIDYYVKLNFFSVIDIIDAIGEIEVNVPVSFCEQDEYRSFAEEDLICLKEGVQKVNGKQALAFARHRKSYTDVMRGKAQQEVIKGTINVLTSPSGAMNINNVLKIAAKAVSTNMPMEQVTNFVSAQLDNPKPWTIDSIVLENGSDAMLVTASMPGQELYVMLLNRLDIQAVFDAYQAMLNQMQFSSFYFHLDHLDENMEELPYVPGIIWAGYDVSAYQLPSEEEPEEEEPVKEEEPPVEVPPTEETPEENPQPTDPEPEDPTPPDVNEQGPGNSGETQQPPTLDQENTLTNEQGEVTSQS